MGVHVKLLGWQAGLVYYLVLLPFPGAERFLAIAKLDIVQRL